MAALLVLVGCPTSDDVELVYDGGNARVDALTGLPDVPDNLPEVGGDDDTSMPQPDAGDGTCQSAADCQFLQLNECEQAVCEAGECRVSDKVDGAPCDDGNACTETQCNAGSCIKTGDTVCPGETDCTAAICSPTEGCTLVDKTVPCDDGDPCTTDDKCNAGVCVGGALTCDLGTLDNPANHCNHIRASDPAATSGAFWVKPVGGGQPIQVYCEMTVAGGGWTRIGRVAADMPICNYSGGFGTAGDLLSDTVATTTVLSAAAVENIPKVGTDLLVTSTMGSATIFRSTSAGFNWTAVADGTVNAVTLVDYNVQASIDGAAFQPLASPGIAAKGPAMLGGNLPSGQSTLFMGLGATWTNTFVQDTTCTNTGGHNGFYGGTAVGPAAWGVAGWVYVK